MRVALLRLHNLPKQMSCFFIFVDVYGDYSIIGGVGSEIGPIGTWIWIDNLALI